MFINDVPSGIHFYVVLYHKQRSYLTTVSYCRETDITTDLGFF